MRQLYVVDIKRDAGDWDLTGIFGGIVWEGASEMRGLSTTQQTVRLSVASVEMTLFGWWERQATTKATATADPYGMTTKNKQQLQQWQTQNDQKQATTTAVANAEFPTNDQKTSDNHSSGKRRI